MSPLVEFERLRDADGKLVIRVWVPMGPSFYTFKGAVYDRVADADMRVKSDAQITSMMARKQGYYSERTVYSWVTEDDLEMGLLGAVRDALRANDADHPWLSLSDGELLRAARLYGRDQLTGERGFNLAAVVLLGKEDTILDVMPLYRTDAGSNASRLTATTTGLSAGAISSGHTTSSSASARSGCRTPSCSMGAAQERARRHRPRACVQLPHPPGVRQLAHRPHHD